ncbi:protein of unknown function [Burkholderia multivorans]
MSDLAAKVVSSLNALVIIATISQSSLTMLLRGLYGNDVIDVQVCGLGCTNMPLFTVVVSSTRCWLKKILVP